MVMFSRLITSLRNNRSLLHLLSDLLSFSHSLESPGRGLCLRMGENVSKMVANELSNIYKKMGEHLHLISSVCSKISPSLSCQRPATMEVTLHHFFFCPFAR